MTILVAIVHRDRVLLAADGSSVVFDRSHPEMPTAAQRTAKLVGLSTAKLMVGTTGHAGDTVEFRDALSRHRFSSWRELADIGREEFISMNVAAADRASRANIPREQWPHSSAGLAAGIIDGKPGAVKFINDGSAQLFSAGACIIGLHAHVVTAMLRFAELTTGNDDLIDTAATLGKLVENVQAVFPDFVLPIDTWELKD